MPIMGLSADELKYAEDLLVVKSNIPQFAYLMKQGLKRFRRQGLEKVMER